MASRGPRGAGASGDRLPRWRLEDGTAAGRGSGRALEAASELRLPSLLRRLPLVLLWGARQVLRQGNSPARRRPLSRPRRGAETETAASRPRRRVGTRQGGRSAQPALPAPVPELAVVGALRVLQGQAAGVKLSILLRAEGVAKQATPRLWQGRGGGTGKGPGPEHNPRAVPEPPLEETLPEAAFAPGSSEEGVFSLPMEIDLDA